ncbi:MAG TPA: bifunctional 4-hydroxy-2-oxoglutarate aldolase/2-dehydro-3-deoxy-phosphogluconate aldolase [Gemmatimonadaceae bacterium]|nr:bifunctional 4-hydroxy-2-oxoglutarate aldolase/2-dehydro-3-deoxy-phosphogluconate aldolase [Gemmatimonadaceae bacterium]
MTDELRTRLRRLRVVPVLVIDEPDAAEPLAAALVEGGLPCAEVTLRTPAALEALRRMAAAQPDLLVGAGTVLTARQAADARAAGARFIVAPGLNERMVDYCLDQGVPVYPGVCTPTEIEAALQLGLRTLKFFPAESMGGLKYLKAIAAPYGQVEFMPTGGIDRAKAAEYLAFDRVMACGGSWVAPADWVRARQFDRVREEARQTVEAVGGRPASA